MIATIMLQKSESVNDLMSSQIYLPFFYIRPVLFSDAAQLHSTFWTERSFLDTQSMIQRALDNEKCNCGIALLVVERQTLAFVGFGQLVPWKKGAEISDLIVAQDWRQRKIGTSLLQNLLYYAQNFRFLMVEIGAASNNIAALSLYQQFGFYKVKTMTLEGQDPIVYLRLSLNAVINPIDPDSPLVR